MLNLNISSEDSNINDFLVSWKLFDSKPNQLIVHHIYDSEVLNIIETKLINTISELIPISGDSNNNYIINDKNLVSLNDDILISYVIIENGVETSFISDITFFYKNINDISIIEDVLDKIEHFIIDDNNDSLNKLNIISITDSNLSLIPLEFDIDPDFKKFYSKNTNKGISKLIKSINRNNKGLSIIYGSKGTGKTSAIKNIYNDLNKVSFFIPNNIIEHTILNPDFINFLKNYNNSVIIIDDFELLSDNYTRYNPIINNILQIVDSLISEVVNINILLIFNDENKSIIDDDLLNCNNLLEVLKFDHLDIDESNELSEHLGNKGKFKNKNKLLDIIKKKNSNNIKRVGF